MRLSTLHVPLTAKNIHMQTLQGRPDGVYIKALSATACNSISISVGSSVVPRRQQTTLQPGCATLLNWPHLQSFTCGAMAYQSNRAPLRCVASHSVCTKRQINTVVYIDKGKHAYKTFSQILNTVRPLVPYGRATQNAKYSSLLSGMWSPKTCMKQLGVHTFQRCKHHLVAHMKSSS